MFISPPPDMQARGRRIKNERLQSDIEGARIFPESFDEALTQADGELDGPADTPFEGGRWRVRFFFPPTYPFESLTAQFLTPIWHPNINSTTGDICVNIFSWTPALTLRVILLSLRGLLDQPQLGWDPQNEESAWQFAQDREGWREKAREWTQLFAVQGGVE